MPFQTATKAAPACAVAAEFKAQLAVGIYIDKTRFEMFTWWDFHPPISRPLSGRSYMSQCRKLHFSSLFASFFYDPKHGMVCQIRQFVKDKRNHC